MTVSYQLLVYIYQKLAMYELQFACGLLNNVNSTRFSSHYQVAQKQ